MGGLTIESCWSWIAKGGERGSEGERGEASRLLVSSHRAGWTKAALQEVTVKGAKEQLKRAEIIYNVENLKMIDNSPVFFPNPSLTKGCDKIEKGGVFGLQWG
jgi:hypothetical protein